MLCLIGSGRKTGAIASELHLSPKTIGTYRQRVLEKLELTTSAELVAYAIRRELV